MRPPIAKTKTLLTSKFSYLLHSFIHCRGCQVTLLSEIACNNIIKKETLQPVNNKVYLSTYIFWKKKLSVFTIFVWKSRSQKNELSPHVFLMGNWWDTSSEREWNTASIPQWLSILATSFLLIPQICGQYNYFYGRFAQFILSQSFFLCHYPTFHDFQASKSVDGSFWTTHNPSIFVFWGSEIAKCSVWYELLALPSCLAPSYGV